MSTRLIGLCALTMGLAMFGVLACEDDSTGPPIIERPPRFRDLTQKWHVLNNIEGAYVKRSIYKYDEALDDNFTFYLSPGDVGGDIPEQWNRDVEITANTNLFDVNYTGLHRCKSIEMDLDLPEDKATILWVEITPASAPDETWYTTTIFYSFRFDTEPDTWYESTPGAKAQFTVRNAGTDDAPRWQLVEMRDLVELLRATSSGVTQPSTWGKVKALYR